MWNELCWNFARVPLCASEVLKICGLHLKVVRWPSFKPRVKSINQMAFGLSPGREGERRSRESTFLCKKLLFPPSVMGSTDAPTPANALLAKGIDHRHVSLNLKSPTPKVFSIFILLFASVLELLVMARVYPPVPCAPFGWYRSLGRCFSLYHRFIRYLQIGAIKCPEKAHGLQAQLPRLAEGPEDQRMY